MRSTLFNVCIVQGPGITFERVGLHTDLAQHAISTAACLGLIALLFAGHIGTGVARVCARSPPCPPLAQGIAAELLPVAEVQDPSQRHVVLRNYAFAPLAEEIVFRGVMWAWLSQGGVAPLQAIAWGPSLFAVGVYASSAPCTCSTKPAFFAAHLHHMLESIRGGRSFGQAALTAAVQLAYTWVFGSIAWVMLLQSGSILACTAAHVLCNCFGLPDVRFLSKASPLHPHKHGACTLCGCGCHFTTAPASLFAALLGVYLLGLVSFCVAVVPVSALGSQYSMWA